MEPLKALLRSQLASDDSATLHVPYILSALTPECFSASSHQQKWSARLNSLMHSKHFGAQWAGLCIAYRTALCSRSIMVENAQSWIGVASSMVSKNVPVPNLKASIRLVAYLFSAATDHPELQRQLATPNVPKFATTLITLVEKQVDLEIKNLALSVLANLIPIYPNLHRPSYAALRDLVLGFINGSAPGSADVALLQSASRLYVALPCTGGKVGSANLWRKSVDETIDRAWAAFAHLRTTYKFDKCMPPETASFRSCEPAVDIPLHLERLNTYTIVLITFLRFQTLRAVQVPLGALVEFVVALIGCTADAPSREDHVDMDVRAMEVTVMPHIWEIGCNLLSCLARRMKQHLMPNVPNLTTIIAYHLEQNLPAPQCLVFLRTLASLLSCVHVMHSPTALHRITKGLLEILTPFLVQMSTGSAVRTESLASGTKKGKKRARIHEDGELFKIGKGVVLRNQEDADCVMAILDAMPFLLSNPYINPALQWSAARTLLGLLLSLRQIPSQLLSADQIVHTQILQKVRKLCAELSSLRPLSRNLSLVIVGNELWTESFDLLIHPRLPPLGRTHLPVGPVSPSFEGSRENQLAKEQFDTETIHGEEKDDQMILPESKAVTKFIAIQPEAVKIDKKPHAPNITNSPGSLKLSVNPAMPSADVASISASTSVLVPMPNMRYGEQDRKDDGDEATDDIPTINMDSDSD